MEDILGRARALQTIVELSKAGPVTMTQFMEASGYVWESAAALLKELEEDGLVMVSERRESGTRIMEISVTDYSRDIAKHSTAIRDIHKKAKEHKARKSR